MITVLVIVALACLNTSLIRAGQRRQKRFRQMYKNSRQFNRDEAKLTDEDRAEIAEFKATIALWKQP